MSGEEQGGRVPSNDRGETAAQRVLREKGSLRAETGDQPVGWAAVSGVAVRAAGFALPRSISQLLGWLTERRR